MKTAPTNKKVRELISMVREGKLIPRPEFQRRLVWTREDKNHFLDTILRGYPFPEIYLADGDVDLQTGDGTQLLVDGLQRVSTIIQYFDGDPVLKLTTVPAYKDLTEDQKREYLQYDVAVRDLGSISRDEIVEVFKRINATKYSLLDIEVNNAVYSGALKKYADKLSNDDFFKRHSTFNAQDYKRMGDLRFALTIVITLLQGYFNRDDVFGEFLDRYNDDFTAEAEVDARLNEVFYFIEECGFKQDSRIWRKADLFTTIIETDQLINIEKCQLQPSEVVERLEGFYSAIRDSMIDERSLPGIYYKAALQASNDRINRIRRGVIIAKIIKGEPEEEIIAKLDNDGMI